MDSYRNRTRRPGAVALKLLAACVLLSMVAPLRAAEEGAIVLDHTAPGFAQRGFEIVAAADAHGGSHLRTEELTGAKFVRIPFGRAGRYDVHLHWGKVEDATTDAPFAVRHAGGTAHQFFDQRDAPGWHFHGSYELSEGSYVQLSGVNADGPVVADAVKLVPTAPRVVERKAKSTLTPIELNAGDELRFTLRNGEVRRVKLLATSAKILDGEPGQVRKYAFDATLEIDGEKHVFERFVPDQRSFYEPLETNGLRLWLDAVTDIFTDDGGFMEEKGLATGTSCRPKRKARLVVNDVGDRICPEKLVWWYPEKNDRLDIANCYRGEDCWMGPYNGKLAHGGLDYNMKSGTPLFAPIAFDDHWLFDSLEAGDNNNRWRGVRQWDDGSTWWLQAHHLNRMLEVERQPLAKGTKYAETAGVRIGKHQHTHFVFRVFEEGEAYWIDPWILFWQTFRDARETVAGTPLPTR
ncbi:MAG: hypothetical protein WD066_07655 [Planctomycetaceae bacterium]